MSQVFLKEMPLEELIERSSFIFVVSKLGPFITKEDVPIHKGKDDVKYPPFTKIISHFEVLEEVYNASKDPLISVGMNKFLEGRITGKKIEVLQGNYSSKLDIHKLFYLEKRSKSYESPIYGPAKGSGGSKGMDLEKQSELIVFLNYNHGEKQFEFAAKSAYESVSKKAKVKKLVKEIKSNG